MKQISKLEIFSQIGTNFENGFFLKMKQITNWNKF
jgi:hypothetical protein